MKRSRIFMGVAALGIAAFGALTSAGLSSTVQAYHFASPNNCQPYEEVECTADPIGGCLGTSGQQLYLQGCQMPLRPNTGF